MPNSPSSAGRLLIFRPAQPESQQGADGGRTMAQRAVLRTESLSVSGVVDNCWIPDAAEDAAK